MSSQVHFIKFAIVDAFSPGGINSLLWRYMITLPDQSFFIIYYALSNNLPQKAFYCKVIFLYR